MTEPPWLTQAVVEHQRAARLEVRHLLPYCSYAATYSSFMARLAGRFPSA